MKLKSVSKDYFDELILHKLSTLGEVQSKKLVGNLMVKEMLSTNSIDIYLALINNLIKKNKKIDKKQRLI